MARKKKAKAKRKTGRRKATPAQLRALAKGRRVMKAKRRAAKKKTSRRRNPVRTQAPSTYLKARSVVNPPRQNPVRQKPAYMIVRVKSWTSAKPRKYFDGTQWTAERKKAAVWHDLAQTKSVAQKVADRTGEQLAIHYWSKGLPR